MLPWNSNYAKLAVHKETKLGGTHPAEFVGKRHDLDGEISSVNTLIVLRVFPGVIFRNQGNYSEHRLI